MDYKIHKLPEGSYDGPIKLDYTDYPSNIELFNGISIGEAYGYVTNAYLNGLINYVDNITAYLIFQYTETEEDKNKILHNIEIITEHEWHHSDLSRFREAVTVLGEIEDSYILFYYNIDIKCCAIERISKEFSREEVVQYMEFRFKSIIESCYWGIYVELPVPIGWIRY